MPKSKTAKPAKSSKVKYIKYGLPIVILYALALTIALFLLTCMPFLGIIRVCY